MGEMRYGVTVPNIGDLDTLIQLGVEADRKGWDGFFLWDHMRFMKDPISSGRLTSGGPAE